MLSLFVEDKEHSDATIPISWCVTRGALEALKAKGCVKPFLFLSIVHSKNEVKRLLVPLDQAMEYVQFSHVGKHRIRAMIVWGSVDDVSGEERMFNNLLSRANHYRFANDLYDWSGEFCERYLSGLGVDHLESVQLEVNVGAEFFAPKPSSFEWWWVNHWFPFPPRDQCHFRGRRCVAYSIQPPIVALWMLLVSTIRTVYAVGSVIFGMRNVHFSPIIHPFSRSTGEICPHVYSLDDYLNPKNNIFRADKNGVRRSSIFLLLHSLLWLVVGTTLYVINHFHVWVEAGVVSVTTLFIVVLAVIICLIKDMIPRLFNPRGKTAWERREDRKQRAMEKKQERYTRRQAKFDLIAQRRKAELAKIAERQEAALQAIVCDGSTAVPKLDALPQKLQTVHLRFQDIKARVCRPFAKS